MSRDSRAETARLVILDRDGVINADSDEYIKSPAEWHAIPGSLEAIARLTQAGFEVVVFTNQSGVARGLFDAETLAAINRKMERGVRAAGGRLAGIYICPHGPDAGCDCRKPRPGLLHAIARERSCDLRGVPVVGDSRRDLVAAEAVGARPILVRTGKGERTLADGRERPAEVYDDLASVTDALLADRKDYDEQG